MQVLRISGTLETSEVNGTEKLELTLIFTEVVMAFLPLHTTITTSHIFQERLVPFSDAHVSSG